MSVPDIIQLVTGNVLASVLLYLLIKEQQSHEATRIAARQSDHDWQERYTSLALEKLRVEEGAKGTVKGA